MLKDALRDITPPLVWRTLRSLRHVPNNAVASETQQPEKDGFHLSGDYQSWDEAIADSTGYDAEVILEKTKVCAAQSQKR